MQDPLPQRRALDADGRTRRSALRLALGAASLPLFAPAAAMALTQDVAFPDPRRRDARIDMALRGRNDARLRFAGVAGERLRVELSIRGAEARFNIWAPETRRAMWIGARSRTPYSFDGVLEKTGVHEVQAFLVGAAARGDAEHPFSIRIRLSGGTS